MAARENFLHLEGNIATDPELRYTASGMAVVTLVVAHTERRQIDGQWQDVNTSYTDCVVFNKLAEYAADTFGKGARVTIDGSLRQRNWVDATTGEKKYKHEVIADSVAASVRFNSVTLPGKGAPRVMAGGPEEGFEEESF